MALVVGALFFFTSPLLFPGAAESQPLGATSARAGSQPLSYNTRYRLDFWQAAAGQFADRPVAGGGFGSFGELSATHLPPAAVRSYSAHNEFLQALAEGGLLWGLPVIGLALAAGIGVLRRVRGRLTGPEPERAVVVGGVLALGSLGLHAAVDVDWSYPALAVSIAVVAGLVLSVPRAAGSQAKGRTQVASAVGACLVLVLGAQVAHAHQATTRDLDRSESVLQARGATAAAQELTDSRSWFPDPRIDARLLGLGLANGPSQPLTLPSALLSEAVERTANYAGVDDDVNARRSLVLLRLGRTREALDSRRKMALALAHAHPASLRAYALLLSLTGERTAATQLLAGTIVLRGPEIGPVGSLGLQLYVLYQQLAELAPGSMELRCAGSALTTSAVTVPEDDPPLAMASGADSCTSLREKGLA